MSPEDHMSLGACLFTWGVLLGGVVALAVALHWDRCKTWWETFRREIEDAL